MRVINEDWSVDAACAGKPFAVFFPEGKHPDYRAAKRVCSTCPVREDCLAEFIGESDGVYGGYSPRERERLRRGSRQWKCPTCGLPLVLDRPDANGIKHVCEPSLFPLGAV